MSLSKQQRIAFAAPCYEATECFNGTFYRYVTIGKRIFSAGITANIGLE